MINTYIDVDVKCLNEQQKEFETLVWKPPAPGVLSDAESNPITDILFVLVINEIGF